MSQITFERTRHRKVLNLFCGNAYIGAIDSGKMVLVPHVEPILPEILAMMPRRFASYVPTIGIPSACDLPARSSIVEESWPESSPSPAPVKRKRGRPRKLINTENHGRTDPDPDPSDQNATAAGPDSDSGAPE